MLNLGASCPPSTPPAVASAASTDHRTTRTSPSCTPRTSGPSSKEVTVMGAARYSSRGRRAVGPLDHEPVGEEVSEGVPVALLEDGHELGGQLPAGRVGSATTGTVVVDEPLDESSEHPPRPTAAPRTTARTSTNAASGRWRMGRLPLSGATPLVRPQRSRPPPKVLPAPPADCQVTRPLARRRLIACGLPLRRAGPLDLDLLRLRLALVDEERTSSARPSALSVGRSCSSSRAAGRPRRRCPRR